MNILRTGSPGRTAWIIVSLLLGTTYACATGGTRIDVRPLADSPREMTSDQQVREVVNRLTFGPRPGDYRRVHDIGVDRWVGEQLAPDQIRDEPAEQFLSRYPSIFAAETTLARVYGAPADLRKAGGAAPDTAAIRVANKASNQTIVELREARIARAVLSERQLREVMVDFWENHFSIFADKGADKYMLVEYDDSVRAHALGKFRTLLGTVAHSPAMLYYLDNWTSRADSDRVTLADVNAFRERGPGFHPRPRHGKGLNENYGRELLELHTLGVDGGYTQQDVIEAARILTGWTIRDPNHSGTFYFNPGMHDAAEKRFLGYDFPAGHGEDEGERLLDIIARQPATAHFIALKLCRRFVSDSPSSDLVRRAADTFTRTDGDISEVMRTIIGSPEFFSPLAYRAKVKSPFEVVVSTLRALNATPDTLQRDVQAVARLGEPLWGHLAPDGYPETGDEWLNTGSILNRINFGMLAASGQLPGASTATWPHAAVLATAPHDVQVDSIVSIVFGGDISTQTRKVLNEGTNPLTTDAPLNGRTPKAPNQLAQILGLALGAPEFQRR